MTQLSELRRFLLSLIGPNADTDASLTQEDWRAVDGMAAQHRLQPYLHGQIERGELTINVPDSIRDDWRQAHRRTALRALAMRKDLLDANALLARHGIAPVALKGAWCAWHAYPAPAERPMRDLDLLVPKDQALEAFNLLLAHGFQQEEASARTPEQSLSHDKHLPPLVSSQGHRFEMHMRLWERDEAIGWSMPQDSSATMYDSAGCTDTDPVRYLAPQDMLAHFVVHGVYSNRLNGGPLTLLDIEHLLRARPIDWLKFWISAEENGWAKGTALLLALVDQWCGTHWLSESACPISLDQGLIDASSDMLLQDLDLRKSVGLATHLSTNLTRAAKRLRGEDRPTFTVDGAEEEAENRLAWFTRRLRESGEALAKLDVRNVASKTVKLGSWLEQDGGEKG